jgi:hypothetical protein
VLVEEQHQTYMADDDADSGEARVYRLRSRCTYRIAFGPRAGQKVLTVQGCQVPALIGFRGV